ncbi:class I SAM-dependent methyltransferase [Haloarcula nitratireducens]|uniref:Class I SAM-dependent methyltransferase n=1 Tax=Haloarcula nitratireducens TaxID=2487749 RepID=A0AAW4P8A0_9EURY|nr:class I SAM-dependent methyltransferase [Halomicroarcula nitratireducens]MBX0294008.1 class I SAM-dependent methyltransferase [Halomicroarcula nitratireducens]
MGFHTFDPDRADQLEDPSRYEYVSVDELLALFDPGPDDVVADLGSGTGFYTDDVAAAAGTVYALDVQSEMHDIYREKGMPENVVPVTATVEAMPVDEPLDAVFSTMTFHEFATSEAMAAVADALEPGGRVGFADWTRNGAGTDGPPVEERYAAADAVEMCEAVGIEVHRAEDRRETFVLEGSL